MKCQNNRGFSLIEVLFATGIIMVLLTALVAGLTFSLSTTQFAKNNAAANRYVEEGLEFARQTRDRATNWETFTSLPNFPAPSPFDRRMQLGADNSGKREVIVTVTWTDNKGIIHTVTGNTYLTKWD